MAQATNPNEHELSRGLVTSIMRFYFFYVTNGNDFTWNSVHRSIWTEVEPAVYLICACIITYKPLVDRITLKRIRKGSSSGSQAQAPSDMHSREEWVSLE